MKRMILISTNTQTATHLLSLEPSTSCYQKERDVLSATRQGIAYDLNCKTYSRHFAFKTWMLNGSYKGKHNAFSNSSVLTFHFIVSKNECEIQYRPDNIGPKPYIQVNQTNF